jgi:hypothetical protein
MSHLQTRKRRLRSDTHAGALPGSSTIAPSLCVCIFSPLSAEAMAPISSFARLSVLVHPHRFAPFVLHRSPISALIGPAPPLAGRKKSHRWPGYGILYREACDKRSRTSFINCEYETIKFHIGRGRRGRVKARGRFFIPLVDRLRIEESCQGFLS